MTLTDKIRGCILGGAIGDAWGSAFENQPNHQDDTKLFVWGGLELTEEEWQLTDDTQLTLATIESIARLEKADPEDIAETFVKWYREGKLSGLGSSTLKAIQELSLGGHWALVGRKGEHAAGNGAAMRIAPLAFSQDPLDRELIREVSRITHHNDEAFAGALAVCICINQALHHDWKGDGSIWNTLITALPDLTIRDRIIEIQNDFQELGIKELARVKGNSGYVVESVPLAIFAATKLPALGFEAVLEQLIDAGGDTDTNCSMAGQIMGMILGQSGLPKHLSNKLEMVHEYRLVREGILLIN